jgi:1-acyl-sn-glycerol-3-phosphate acyltransferase
LALIPQAENAEDQDAVSSSSTLPPSQDVAVSPLAISAVRGDCERRLIRHFHSVRLSRSRRPNFTTARQRPLVVYCNHSSWWDPLVCLHLASQLLPGRRHFAPIEHTVLRRHPWLLRCGFFDVDPESARGARRFFEQATRILEQPDATLWVAGSVLADPRKRPLELHPGLGHLAARTRHAVLLPLALEYPFWAEPLPEALARFGEEQVAEDVGMRALYWTEVLAERLQNAQDALASEALSRDEAGFEVMCGNGAGVQEAWSRLRAMLRGRRPKKERGAALPGTSEET